MDIILLLLARPLDKHRITLMHITYPPLDFADHFLAPSFLEDIIGKAELIFLALVKVLFIFIDSKEEI